MNKRKGLLAFLLAWIIFSFPIFASAEALKTISHGSREEKCIALTFDDGPHPRYTERILEILKKYDVKATFFMIGSNVEQYPEIAAKVAKEGHEIGSHTYSHPQMLHIEEDVFFKEIKCCEEALAQCGIPRPRLFRPPQGFRTERQCEMLCEAGYSMVIWSLDTHDWKSVPSKEIVKFVFENVQGGDILLFHDYVSGQNTTITALEQIIPKLQQDGYRFVAVSSLSE